MELAEAVEASLLLSTTAPTVPFSCAAFKASDNLVKSKQFFFQLRIAGINAMGIHVSFGNSL